MASTRPGAPGSHAFAIGSVCWTSLLGCAVFALLALPSAPFPRCFFKSDVCGFPCPCLLGPASVAVYSTSFVTTAQRARGQVSWLVTGSPLQAQGLPRGRCPRLHQPVRVGLGLASCASRWSTIGSSLTGFRSSMVLIDTTLVSPVCADGLPRVSVLTWTAPLSPKPVVSSNALIQSSGTHGRARLVVLAAEIGGRWSEEARAFVSQLAKTKARSVPRIFAGRARQAWHHRWSSTLACANHLPCCWIVGLLWVATENFHLRPLVVKECRHLPFDSTL